jgi:hypothetical protein
MCNDILSSKNEGWTCSTWMRETRNAYKILVGEAEWKRPLERCRRRWKGNIRMNLKETL